MRAFGGLWGAQLCATGRGRCLLAETMACILPSPSLAGPITLVQPPQCCATSVAFLSGAACTTTLL